jgi:transposase
VEQQRPTGCAERQVADRLPRAGKPREVFIVHPARKHVTIVNALCKNRQKWTTATA